jgi:hypothetical protein
MLHLFVGLLFCGAGLCALAIIGGTIAGDARKISRALGYVPVPAHRTAAIRPAVTLRRRALPARPVPGRPASPTRAAA